MSNTVGAYEAKTRFSALLKRVEHGESITITRHGNPVAVLSPPAQGMRRDAAQLVAEMRALSEGMKLGGLPVKELIAEGRR